jgi:hypothetical protein
MTEQQRLEVIQGVIDRLLYLNDADKKEFMMYMDALFSVYKHDRHTKWGAEVYNIKTEDHEA